MQWRNTQIRYGIVSAVLHWGVALTVFAMFGVGLYMVGLSYYDSLYNALPRWHRSVGMILFAVVLMRLIWRWISPPPPPPPSHSRMERLMAAAMHWVLYLLLLALFVSGYLISTADGRGFSLFNWFEVPALTGRIPNMEDTAGLVHEWLAWTLVVLAALHAAAALKHHLVDRDETLLRMLGRSSRG